MNMNTTINEYMITVAESLRLGAAEDIVRLAMRADGFSPNRIDTMIRWCKLYNERTTYEHEQAYDVSGEGVSQVSQVEDTSRS
jgi:hypothetical protein